MENFMIRTILFWEGAKERLADQKGQGLTEYVLILGLIVITVAALINFTGLGTALQAKIAAVITALQ